MITLEERIARMERLLRRLEEDQPYLRVRLSPLGKEHRESSYAFADRIRAEAEAELHRLLGERVPPLESIAPQPADEPRGESPQPPTN
ncbi:MAG: hypothetical protein ABSG70_14345 [Terriglobales bacterium]|jgi:hypothetical protein